MKKTTAAFARVRAPYPLLIGDGVIGDADAWRIGVGGRPPIKQAAIVSDSKVFPLYGASVLRALAAAGITKKPATIFILPRGERAKKWNSVIRICDALAEARLPRDGLVVALGGGVVGDVGGFAAAVYMRGVALIQVPTTLLAQADASIGGKTGINLSQGKNLAGAFHRPRAVLCDCEALATLPTREYRAGFAEIVKHGLIADPALFSFLEKNAAALINRDSAALRRALIMATKIKVEIVAADEREAGRRALLNLGHTFAHALENAAGYGKWRHGEAVAAGLVAAARLSERVCGLSPAVTERIIALLRALRLPAALPVFSSPDSRRAFDRALLADKKIAAGKPRFVLLRALGDAYLEDKAKPAQVRAAMREAQK